MLEYIKAETKESWIMENPVAKYPCRDALERPNLKE